MPSKRDMKKILKATPAPGQKAARPGTIAQESGVDREKVDEGLEELRNSLDVSSSRGWNNQTTKGAKRVAPGGDLARA